VDNALRRATMGLDEHEALGLVKGLLTESALDLKTYGATEILRRWPCNGRSWPKSP
jgi:hypothetical protein